MRALFILAAALLSTAQAGPAAADNYEPCRQSLETKQTRSFTGFVRCINKVDQQTLRSQTPHHDLIGWLAARRLAIAERVDKGSLSQAEGFAEIQGAGVAFTTAHQQRVSMTQAAQQAAQPQSRMVICNTNSFSTLCF